MLLSLCLAALSAAALPNAEDVPLVLSGESVTLDVSGGTEWIRILEEDYTCLLVTASGDAELRAYDVNGDPLAAGSGGRLILSAFSDYWFYISVSAPGRPSVTVEDVNPRELALGVDVPGSVPGSSMAETFTFSPQASGSYTVRLEGAGDTDLDLEVYGAGMRLWGSSMSLESMETVTVPLLPDEEVTAVVSRYGKGGSGEYSISVRPSGEFPVLREGGVPVVFRSESIQRFLIPPHDGGFFLDLAINTSGADVDLLVRDPEGGVLMNSSTYSSVETLLMPPDGSVSVAEALVLEAGENEAIAGRITTREHGDVLEEIPLKEILPVGEGSMNPPGFSPAQTGIYHVSVEFEKTRDGDVRIFRGWGQPSVTFSSARGRESFLLHVQRGDTVWVDPFYGSIDTFGDATLRIGSWNETPAEGIVRGSIGEDDPVAMYTASVDEGSILDVRLHGHDREVDLDLFVSGPGLDLAAAGWLSNVDAAGDEAVEAYAEDDGLYGVTVYLYDREGNTDYDLELNTIESVPLAEPSQETEIWALSAGISGYASAADILNRASMDAVEFYRFLTEEQDVAADHVVLLVDAMATSGAFLDGLGALMERAGPEDRVVLFYSGHGDQSHPGSGGPEEEDSANEYLCLYDGDISDDTLSVLIGPAPEAPVFLFLDACHSGGFVNDFTETSGAMVLTAAREDLSVSERILTPILLQGSRGDADSDGNGYVSAMELMAYIDRELQLICPECDAPLAENENVCPECGAVLEGDNAVPRPEQGVFLNSDVELFRVQ